MDSVISWAVLTALSFYGLFKLMMVISAEQDCRREENERAWRMEGK